MPPPETFATPSAGYRAVPKERYTSREYLRAEFEQLWPRVWLAAGAARDLPNPGSYFTFELGSESILCVRQSDAPSGGAGSVRAFHNVCRHRGRRLREPGLGRANSFQCPYHGWEWSFDGRLKHVPDEASFPCFPAASDPARAEFGLKSVACEEWSGLIWICMSDNPPPLREYLGPMSEAIEAYRFESYDLVEDLTVDLPCNWKVAVDAFNEGYHVKAIHPELAGIFDESPRRTDFLGRHSREVIRFFASPTPPGGPRWMLTESGLDPARIDLSAPDVRARIQAGLRARERAGDFDFSKLSDEQLTDNNQLHVFPNLQLTTYALRLTLLRSRPHPTDPGRMLFDQQQWSRVPAGQPRMTRPPHRQFALGAGSMGTATDQDLFNLVRVQQGMQSSGFRELVLGDQELFIRHMHETLDSYIPAEIADASRG